MPLRQPLCMGQAFRFAPARQGKPAAFFWRFWVQDNEVYGLTRSLGDSMKLSFHESGQIHIRQGKRDMNKLAPPLLMGQWLHAIELRFLISPDALPPLKEDLKNKRFNADSYG